MKRKTNTGVSPLRFAPVEMTCVGGGVEMTCVGGGVEMTCVGGGVEMACVGGGVEMTCCFAFTETLKTL